MNQELRIMNNLINSQKLTPALLFFLFIIHYSLFIIPSANAQFNLPNIGNIKPTISLTSDPLTPLPNSTITIVANLSGIVTAGNSNYTWFLNGIRQSETSGSNKKTFTLKTGLIGTIYRVNINVTTPSADILSDTINFTVSDVDLTWITNSKTPITYKAKIIPTQNSFVTLSALPLIYAQGTKTKINPSNLIYNWMLDGKLDNERSGVNRSSYNFRVNKFFGNSHLVRLEVKTENNAVSLSKDVIIPVVRPQIWLYFSDSKTNLPYGAALKSLTTKPADFNFIAQTYFFNVLGKNLKWQWTINNTEIDSGSENPWLATLNLKDRTPGQFSTQIQVTAKNPNNELESAQSTINLEIKQ